MHKIFLLIGSIAMALVVALGAFGAHGLKEILADEMLDIFETGVKYHFYHALGLLVISLVAQSMPNSALLQWSGWLMVAGITIFSGSLYVLSVYGIKWLGAITPIGGLCFISAWILLALAAWQNL